MHSIYTVLYSSVQLRFKFRAQPSIRGLGAGPRRDDGGGGGGNGNQRRRQWGSVGPRYKEQSARFYHPRTRDLHRSNNAIGNEDNHRNDNQDKRQGNQATIQDDYEWKEVRKRRNRRVYGRGEAGAGGLVGAPPPTRPLWLSRVVTGDTQIIRNYLSERNVMIDDDEIVKVSHEDAKFHSYKIYVSVDSLNTVLDDDFWPNGIRCELWRERNMNNDVDYNSDRFD